MKKLLNSAQAWTLLAPHADDLRACIRAGWNDWVEAGERVPHLRAHWNSRTRASIVHNGIVAEVYKRFHNKAGVNILRMRGLIILSFEGAVTLRFKKVDRRFRSRSIQTEQTQKFQWQMELDGMDDEATNIVAGYLLTDLQDEIQSTWLVCPLGKSYEWKLQLDAAPQVPTPLAAGNPGDPGKPGVASKITKVVEKRRDA